MLTVDVTTPVRFAMDDTGLKLQGKTKSNVMGFYNPIPDFMQEHDHPTLCIIYKRPLLNPDHVYVTYYRDNEDVSILFDLFDWLIFTYII